MVGGRVRGNFTAEEGEASKLSVLLMPQRPGYLMLPALDVRVWARPAPQQKDDSNSSNSSRPISCDVNYQSLAEAIYVSSDATKTTVFLQSSPVE